MHCGIWRGQKNVKLVRQEEIEFFIAHGRWIFDWCTQDKLLFSCRIDTYLQWWSMKPLYRQINKYIYIKVCIKREGVTVFDQLIQFDIFFLSDCQCRSEM